MEYNKYDIGDIVKTKKSHPCGSNQWEITKLIKKKEELI